MFVVLLGVISADGLQILLSILLIPNRKAEYLHIQSYSMIQHTNQPTQILQSV